MEVMPNFKKYTFLWMERNWLQYQLKPMSRFQTHSNKRKKEKMKDGFKSFVSRPLKAGLLTPFKKKKWEKNGCSSKLSGSRISVGRLGLDGDFPPFCPRYRSRFSLTLKKVVRVFNHCSVSRRRREKCSSLSIQRLPITLQKMYR